MTTAQAAWLYNRGAPIGQWKLDECQGTTVYDDSNFGNNGTIVPGDTSGSNDSVGTCSSGAGDEMWDNGTVGKRNASLDFDGTNDYVDMNDPDELDIAEGESFSIEAWVSRDTYNTFDVIVAKDNDISVSTTDGYALYIHPGDLVQFTAGNGSGAVIGQGPSTITDSNWHHIVVTYEFDGSGGNELVRIYIDGIPGTIGQGGGSNPDNALDFRIGSESDGGNPFDGQIDQVKFYSYPLSPDQVKKAYNNGAVYFGP